MTGLHKHIILTGGLQVGKTWLVNRIAALEGVRPGGFATHFDDRADPERKLLLSPAGDPGESRTVAEFREGAPARVLANVFDGYGVDLLTARNQHCNLIIMDECGRFEAQARRFQDAVVSMLDGDKPVLGVMRQTDEPGWLEQLTVHPKASVLLVTPENRDELAEVLARHFAGLLGL